MKSINNPLEVYIDIISKKAGTPPKEFFNNYEINAKIKGLCDILVNLGFTKLKEFEVENEDINNNIPTKGIHHTSYQLQPSDKILIFTQYNSTIKIIEDFLLDFFFKPEQVKQYSSKLNEHERFEIIEEFNNNEDVKILILNTGIGGLGLNLTAANIVIMFDHSWNPMKDLQAMDRAHRLGQKKTVKVFRLIVANSYEEKKINLQEFKKYIADAIVNASKSSEVNINVESFMNSFETMNNKIIYEENKKSLKVKSDYKKEIAEKFDNDYKDLDELNLMLGINDDN